MRRYDDHITAKLAKAQEAKEAAQADDLLRELRAIRQAYSLLLQAEASGDLGTAQLGIREARSCSELLAKLEGKVNRQPRVNVLLLPEWLTVRAIPLAAPRPYPETHRAVAERLLSFEAG